MRRRTRIFFKRHLCLACRWAIVPLALVALRLAWGVEASHRLNSTRQSLRALNIPSSPSDLPDPAKIPPDQDAVAPLKAAMAKFTPSTEERNAIDSPDPAFQLDTHKFTPEEATAL
ncbi:MAG TPA: hypothetical protein VGN88_00805, partial [Phycisphaerae bacterium]